jgi:hypothetical protein
MMKRASDIRRNTIPMMRAVMNTLLRVLKGNHVL